MFDHLAIVAVIAAVLSTGCTNAVNEPQFKITTKRDNDKVEVKVESGKTVFSVHSPFGISQSVIERTEENWSDIVMLRLHLKGLENFKVTNGNVTVESAVSVHLRQSHFQVLKLSNKNLLEASDVSLALDDDLGHPIFAIRPSIDSIVGIVVADVPGHCVQRLGQGFLPHSSQYDESEKEWFHRDLPHVNKLLQPVAA